jgi:ABC-type dipeptide/oligopeptide/nickel transport system permease subunit
MTDSAPGSLEAEAEAGQWTLIRERFKRHRLARVSRGIIGLYLLVVVFADFLAPYSATARDPNYVKGPPELVKVWDGGPARPFADGQITRRGGQETGFGYQVVAVEEPKTIRFLVRGEPWSVFGLFETDRHLFGVDPITIPGPEPISVGDADVAAGGLDEVDPQPSDDPFAGVQRDADGGLVIGAIESNSESNSESNPESSPESAPDAEAEATSGSTGQDTTIEATEPEIAPGFIHLLGTDGLGRDQFSRILFATRSSLTIGLAGLVTAFVLGLFFGGVAGYFGGTVDYLIQRLIEVVRSIPTIPLVMGLAAAFPQDWSNLRVFFFTSLILGMVGWTTLARRIRTMLLTLADEDFVVAARLSGAGPFRVITRHMLPSFFSYIVVALAIEFPYMILAESVLSFVGLGLRPPTVSWGVLLQEAQRVEVLEQTPWLLAPAVFVIIIVLAFNFVGDGLRDAADPYSEDS